MNGIKTIDSKIYTVNGSELTLFFSLRKVTKYGFDHIGNGEYGDTNYKTEMASESDSISIISSTHSSHCLEVLKLEKDDADDDGTVVALATDSSPVDRGTFTHKNDAIVPEIID